MHPEACGIGSIDLPVSIWKREKVHVGGTGKDSEHMRITDSCTIMPTAKRAKYFCYDTAEMNIYNRWHSG